MIRRNCRSLLRFGLVAVALLLALPAPADQIEPEPYPEEEVVEPEAEPVVEAEVAEKEESKVAEQPNRSFDQILDLLVMRPAGLVTTVVGGVFFVPAALMASLSGPEGVQAAWEHFVVPSVERTFMTPLGKL